MNTMQDIEKLALQEPIVKSYIQHVRYGNMTMEQALIGMVVSLTIAKDEVQNNYINHMHNCTTPSIIKSFAGVGPNPTIAKQIEDKEDLK
ncbi:hypothetical protein B1748_23460 [Paenibacillus sp. MY03]|uniref:hypothetical protein n=1 Tax=Paenibacillus sp. MY03 TaxID=302980 RepID=UPI000B3C20E5|nr:hypothetical protein [Paenibacillus sp. MY03]OUS72969.1 hypothetical protein B1748_23460 [Paenibacillus sp. MY03]